jgi:hypothetical protein
MRAAEVRGLRTEDFFVNTDGKDRTTRRRGSAKIDAEKDWSTASSSSGGDSPESEMRDAEEEILREHVP